MSPKRKEITMCLQPSPATNPERAVHAFCDLSNMYFTLQNHYKHSYEGLRINFPNFNELLIGCGRQAVQSPLWVTSDKGWERTTRIGKEIIRLAVNFQIRPRVNGSEIDVDDYLLDAIEETLARHRPSVLVLASGDGAGSRRGKGFLHITQRARGLGWAVEVLAWPVSCHGELRRFAEAEHGFTNLENHFNSITHVEGSRRAQEISWKRRAFATFPRDRCAA